MDPQQFIGQQIDQYRIEAHIARGGMADVFLARDVSLDRQVAFKILLSNLAQDPQFKLRFQREAQVVARLNHPNIVQVYNTGLTPFGQPYIAMQYIPGGSLGDLLRRWEAGGKVAPAPQSLAVVRHIAAALTVAHQQGIVHRDLKPSNVLIRPDGTPVLVDLGIAAVEGGEKLTQTGSLIGTPHYMSPEQVRGMRIDGRSDIYSLGVILYEMLAGIRPFEADESIAILHKQVYEAPTPIEHLRPGLSRPTLEVVDKCLQKDPNQRYQTADELVRAIDQALQVEGQQGYLLRTTVLLPEGENELISKSRLRPVPPVPPRQGSSSLWKGIAGGVILILLALFGGFLGWQYLGHQDPAPTETVESVVSNPTTAGQVVNPTDVNLPSEVPDEETQPPTDIPTQEVQENTPEPPSEQPPTEQPPTEEPPTEQPPTEEPPTITPSPTPDRGPEQFSIGQSVNKNPLNVVRFGHGRINILFVGGIHAGNAPGTVEVARRAVAYFSDNLDEIPENSTLYILENLNPDSPNAVDRPEGRLNANGVDLNRNWDCDWKRDPDVLGSVIYGGGGNAPLSEPETRSLANFIDEIDPVVVLFWGASGGVSAPGECGGVSRVSVNLANIFADASGYRYYDGGSVQGDASNWLDKEGIPAIFSLLKDRSSPDWNNNLAGMRAVLEAYGN